ASTYLKIGDLYASREEINEAINAYLKAVQLTPKSLQSRMLVAMMYDRQKEYEKANKIYREILDVNDNFAPAANNLAWNIVEQGGNLDIAFRWAQKARDVDPHNPRVADTLGWISYKLGLFAKAIDLLKESNDRLENKNPAMLYRLGMAYYSGGERKEARETLAKALALSRNFEGVDEAARTVAVLGSEAK
ncbi:MAG TPA: tetratricopeptide repeat protein, partial [Candidatus Binatia bacterium]|nr:tetratricopeptide repeat protein [Candidatus Binatia bacterium]